ncbi:MAG: leucine--tRNA ligase [archaeon]|nr:MAG: leucine--tRNA ligase [archaeon]
MAEKERIDFKRIEKKWQEKWKEAGIFEVKEDKKKKFYVLEMFPYPSGSGLHMGHAFNYTISDIYVRLKRMQGFNVLYPVGYDSLGLPAENAAIEAGVHPKDYIEKSIENFISQQKSLGLSYDWSRLVKSHDPEFYKWDQWIFLKMLEKGIAFRKKAPVNWCPKCKTVLANEQVHNGKCWRHEDTDVEVKHLEQWFFRITNYAEELYEDIKKLEKWPDDVKAMQRHWIGKSYGIDILFEIDGEKWPVFTTRPDTIFGVTFMVISAQHPRLMKLVKKEHKEEVERFLKKIKSTSEKDMEELEKEGAFTGSYAINPVNGDKIPVYTGNFVIADYGSGMVMAVPAHDHRDFEFANKYDIPIKIVIQPRNEMIKAEEMKGAFVDEGILVNSSKFDGIESQKAIDEISEYLEKKGMGKKTVQYKLRDWLISRQRYWGTPIPVIYCEKCGIAPVPEKNLPVTLPEDVKFGEGNPLKTSEDFVNTTCPNCGEPAKRETDTMDTFVNSSWYFLRYCDPKNNDRIFDKKKVEYWMPIDRYIGGKEHACMHLIYFRFYTKFLRDIGLLNFDEPAFNLFNQGMLHGDDGFVMSKSRGNVVLPSQVSEEYGIDTARLFLVSVASPDKDVVWSEKGIEGSLRFIKRIWTCFEKIKTTKADKITESKANKTVKEVTECIEDFRYNLAIIKLREFLKIIESKDKVAKGSAEIFLKLLHPFCPHIAEELWEKIGNKQFISTEKWPEFDESKIDLEAEMGEKLVKNILDDIDEIKKITGIETPKRISIFVSPEWKYDIWKGIKEGKEVGDFMKEEKYKKVGKELVNYAQGLMKKRPTDKILNFEREMWVLKKERNFLEKETGANVLITEARKSDEKKAKQAEPMKPGILIE